MAKTDLIRKIFLLCVYAIAFACVESAVVVYLRALYYPSGFEFPLHPMVPQQLMIETMREIATLIMLLAIALLSGRSRWQRFAFFLIAFGVWDISCYVWLKVFLNWPASLLDWDILFLVPLPWIAPVIAPIIISIVFVLGGLVILRNEGSNLQFHPLNISWVTAVVGTGIILYTFLNDLNATLHFGKPHEYSYGLFLTGVAFYLIVLIMEWRRPFNQISR